MPHLQHPDATYPTARLLACLGSGGPSGKVFWNEKEYPMFNSDNEIQKNRPLSLFFFNSIIKTRML